MLVNILNFLFKLFLSGLITLVWIWFVFFLAICASVMEKGAVNARL